MLKNFIKSIFKNTIKYYTDIEDKVNICEIYKKNNPYGHVKEFVEFDKRKQYEAHRVIANKAMLLSSNNINFGVVTDVNGNLYYFDIFEDGMYRIVKIDEMEEFINERNT